MKIKILLLFILEVVIYYGIIVVFEFIGIKENIV